MDNAPFRFLDSPAAVSRLRAGLAQVGLSPTGASCEEEGAANPYHPACLRFACPWLREQVEVYWHYCWWPDGVRSELGRDLEGRGPEGRDSTRRDRGR